MLDILARSIAHAGGIEVPGEARIVEPARRPGILRRLADAYSRWQIRRSTYLVLRELDDKTLADIGLYRGIVWDAADAIGRHAVANDNDLPVALSQLATNDNDGSLRAG